MSQKELSLKRIWVSRQYDGTYETEIEMEHGQTRLHVTLPDEMTAKVLGLISTQVREMQAALSGELCAITAAKKAEGVGEE